MYQQMMSKLFNCLIMNNEIRIKDLFRVSSFEFSGLSGVEVGSIECGGAAYVKVSKQPNLRGMDDEYQSI